MAPLIRRPSLGLRGHSFDESITLPRHRLDVSSARALVAKDCSEAADEYVKAVIKIDGRIGPQPARDLFTSNQLAGPLDQQTKQVDGLSAEPDPVALQPSGTVGDRQTRSLQTSSPRQNSIVSGSRLRFYALRP